MAEGQVTEPDYCTALNKYFRDQHEFDINTAYSENKGLHPLEVAEEAISAATQPDREGDGPPHEIWAMFDRDQHPDVREAFARLRKHNATAALNDYKEVGIAFSHPSFDLWLLLHFQSLTTPQDGFSIQVHEKLRGYPAFERSSRGSACTTDRGGRPQRSRSGQAMYGQWLLAERRSRGGLRSPAQGPVDRRLASDRKPWHRELLTVKSLCDKVESPAT